MSRKHQTIIYLVVLAIFDTVIPVPITALTLIYVVLQKPGRFRQWVDEIYRD